MRENNGDDKRSSPRLKVPVYIQTFEKTFPLGTLINLSPQGLFVQTTEPKEVGTLLDIRFQLPGSEHWTRLRAEVVRANRPPGFPGDDPNVSPRRSMYDNPGMGLAILSIAPESEAELEAFLQSSQEEE